MPHTNLDDVDNPESLREESRLMLTWLYAIIKALGQDNVLKVPGLSKYESCPFYVGWNWIDDTLILTLVEYPDEREPSYDSYGVRPEGYYNSRESEQ